MQKMYEQQTQLRLPVCFQDFPLTNFKNSFIIGQRLNCAKGHDFPLLDDIGKIINLPAACNVLVCLLNITCQYQCNDKLTGDASELIKILIFPGICDDTKDRFGRSLRPCVDDGVLAVSKCLNAAGKPTSSI